MTRFTTPVVAAVAFTAFISSVTAAPTALEREIGSRWVTVA